MPWERKVQYLHMLVDKEISSADAAKTVPIANNNNGRRSDAVVSEGGLLDPPVATRSAIELEGGLPTQRLNELVKIEGRGPEISRPPLYLHKWWARRFGSIFRSILLATLLDEGNDVWAAHYQKHDFSHATICDPFMGGGTTLFEASRLNANVIGCDLNPVAWWTTRAALTQPRDWNTLVNTFEELISEADLQFAHLFQTRCPICKDDAASSRHYRWVRVLPCSSCGAETDLFRSHLLGTYLGSRWYHCPSCEHIYLTKTGTPQEQCCPRCDAVYDATQGSVEGGAYRCKKCGQYTKIRETMKSQSDIQKCARLFAVLYNCPAHGWGLAEPTELDFANNARASELLLAHEDELLIPSEPISLDKRTDPRPVNYGFTHWRQLFSPRQLLVLGWLSARVSQLPPEPRDVLATVISQLTNYTNNFCVPRPNRPAAISWIFRMHAFIPPVDYIEANPLSSEDSSGSLRSLFYRSVANAYQYRNVPTERKTSPISSAKTTSVQIVGESVTPTLADSWSIFKQAQPAALILNGSSDSLPIPDQCVTHVITDPPFYDNVMYGELSEFNYVWLRGMLKHAYKQFEAPIMDHGREIVANRRIGKDDEFYGNGLASVWKECHRVLADSGLLVFTFHHRAIAAWTTLLASLIAASFKVEAVHPVLSESDRSLHIMDANSIDHDVVVVCKKAGVLKRMNWVDLQARLRAGASTMLEQVKGLHDPKHSNVSMIAFGHCLRWLSEYTAYDQATELDIDLGTAVAFAFEVAMSAHSNTTE